MTYLLQANDELLVAPAFEMLYGSPEDQSVGSFSPPPSAGSHTPSPSVEVLPNQILSGEEMKAATPPLVPSDAEEATGMCTSYSWINKSVHCFTCIIILGRPVLREEHPVSLIRANVEMGNLAHFLEW